MSTGIKTSYDHILTVGNNFFREDLSSCDKFLYNTDWVLLPCIAFNEWCPYFLTCRHHKYGTLNKYVHLLRYLKSRLSSAISDHLCHAVIKTITVAAMKKGAFLIHTLYMSNIF